MTTRPTWAPGSCSSSAGSTSRAQGPVLRRGRAGETSTHAPEQEHPCHRQRPAGALHGAAGQGRPARAWAHPPAGSGSRYFWSTQGDNLNTTMTKTGIDRDVAHREGELPDRGRVGLRVPRGVERRWTTWTPVLTKLVRRRPTPVTTRAASTPVAPASPGRRAGSRSPAPCRPAPTPSASATRPTVRRWRAVSASTTSPSTARSSAPRRPRPRAGPSTGSAHDRLRGGEVLQRLHRREPPVRRLRRVARHGVQLRLAEHTAGPGASTSPYQNGAAAQLMDGAQGGQRDEGDQPGGAEICRSTPHPAGRLARRTLLRPRVKPQRSASRTERPLANPAPQRCR